MVLTHFVETLNLLGDESRLRLCALLRERELCVTYLVRVTGISQSRVSTHLGRLREGGFVRDRRQGQQAFYALALDSLPQTARTVLDEAARCRHNISLSELGAAMRSEGLDGLEDIGRVRAIVLEPTGDIHVLKRAPG